MKTLEQILEKTKTASKKGSYGIEECKKAVLAELNFSKRSNKYETLYTLLEFYVDRARNDMFFNENMVQACWQLINER